MYNEVFTRAGYVDIKTYITVLEFIININIVHSRKNYLFCKPKIYDTIFSTVSGLINSAFLANKSKNQTEHVITPLKNSLFSKINLPFYCTSFSVYELLVLLYNN